MLFMGKSTISIAIFHCELLVHQRVGLNHQPVMETSVTRWAMEASMASIAVNPMKKKRHGIPRNPIESYENSH